MSFMKIVQYCSDIASLKKGNNERVIIIFLVEIVKYIIFPSSNASYHIVLLTLNISTKSLIEVNCPNSSNNNFSKYFSISFLAYQLLKLFISKSSFVRGLSITLLL